MIYRMSRVYQKYYHMWKLLRFSLFAAHDWHIEDGLQRGKRQRGILTTHYKCDLFNVDIRIKMPVDRMSVRTFIGRDFNIRILNDWRISHSRTANYRLTSVERTYNGNLIIFNHFFECFAVSWFFTNVIPLRTFTFPTYFTYKRI